MFYPPLIGYLVLAVVCVVLVLVIRGDRLSRNRAHRNRECRTGLKPPDSSRHLAM